MIFGFWIIYYFIGERNPMGTKSCASSLASTRSPVITTRDDKYRFWRMLISKGLKSQVTGFTGLSLLHKLHPLYGFNVLHNLVFDTMYIIPLNVASHHLHYYFNEEILSRQDVDRRLKIFSGLQVHPILSPVERHEWRLQALAWVWAGYIQCCYLF